MEFKEKLELLSGNLEKLLSDGATYTEVLESLKALAVVAGEFQPDATEEQMKALLMEALEWANAKYMLYKKLEEAIKLNAALEFVDDLLIPIIAEQLLVPMLAKLVTKG
jgi:hypothetical protein